MRTLLHLARRFFGWWRAGRPDPPMQLWIGSCLGPAEARLFWEQPVQDQAHAAAVGAYVAQRRPERGDLIAAALLHDVGKAASRLGPVRRSLATVLGGLRLPMPRQFSAYRNHGSIGAEMLEGVKAPAIAIAFARHHGGAQAPSGVAPTDWTLLREADHGA
ncbi:MAG: HD domain-containing protein [Acidimicrobiia bacterium]